MNASLVKEIDSLINEIEDFLSNSKDATDVETQKLLNEKTRLQKELKRLNTVGAPLVRSPTEGTTSATEHEYEGNSRPLSTTYKRTDLTIFPTSSSKVKIILNPKLPGIASEELYLILKASEAGEPQVHSTNVPCFIPFNVKKNGFKEYTHRVVELLEAYLLRKHYVELTRKDYSAMLHSPLQVSFPCDFVQFGVSISTETPTRSQGYVMFCLFYKLDEIYARDVYVGFNGSEEFILYVEKDIEEESALFKSCSLNEAFNKIF